MNLKRQQRADYEAVTMTVGW
ncbi:hypothetical protein CCACVL1_10783 [Corchorus capsularis]|uniref:Uncharacterized protein n=1 Tax=Corchorus capsularis TaxID=210143 RepID=A0A1R3IPP7_COCAP|nr:hypothetical protein CCACVL1_10783 [Corchorus capsularis]